MDALERKMKDTPVEKALDEIFRGETLRYVRCLNVPFESTGKEPFYDVAVTVKGMPSLERSLAAFVEPEFLVGENSYNAEGYGLQEAKLGVVFATLPPVLHIQLKRFEYDFERDRVVKVPRWPPQFRSTIGSSFQKCLTWLLLSCWAMVHLLLPWLCRNHPI